jgi:hypothetical protein
MKVNSDDLPAMRSLRTMPRQAIQNEGTTP